MWATHNGCSGAGGSVSNFLKPNHSRPRYKVGVFCPGNGVRGKVSALALEPLVEGDPAEIAGYRLRGRLGAGGMGRVYLAFTRGGRPVALKVVRAELGEDPDFRARFRQEVAAARRVHGLFTAQVLDADPDASPPWLVTVYVVGPSLAQAVAGHGPLPAGSVLALVAGVAEALAAIHAAGVVHRDLKPSNVLLASTTSTGSRSSSPETTAGQ